MGRKPTDKNRLDNPVEKTKDTPQRRSFLKILWITLGLVALVEVVMVIISFFRPVHNKKIDSAQKRLIDAGSTDAYKPGTVAAFAQGQFYLVCLEDGGFLAVSGRCTHLGCALPWDKNQQKFICPCHASQFDMFGNVLNSPAPRALDLFKIRLENKQIQVNINNRIKRSRFNQNQVVYPETVTFVEKAGRK